MPKDEWLKLKLKKIGAESARDIQRIRDEDIDKLIDDWIDRELSKRRSGLSCSKRSRKKESGR